MINRFLLLYTMDNDQLYTLIIIMSHCVEWRKGDVVMHMINDKPYY